ncbi:MAG TPA: hypothetical protein PKC97_07325 [Burkholderiaceae bacterium]|mgnify:CR=1 FL=1|jgi:hypothetical protein|nr:hypothetical protein [Burkholderiaceae bacterium]
MTRIVTAAAGATMLEKALIANRGESAAGASAKPNRAAGADRQRD